MGSVLALRCHCRGTGRRCRRVEVLARSEGLEVLAELNIPTGIPLKYELDADFVPLKRGGEYLDPTAAAAAIEAVKNQGKK